MRHIFIVLILAITTVGRAEASSLIIQPRFVTSFRFTATDAWNLDLQFSGTKPVRITLDAIITGAGNNQVASLRSSVFVLNPGVQSYSATTMSTAQLNYLSKEIADIESLTGSFPAGSYKICYSPRCADPDCDGNGKSVFDNETPECFELMIEPPTPLLLAFPSDKSELEAPRPTFNWIPPMPLASISGFNYMYTLVVKNKNQTCTDAVQTNRPMYQQAGVQLPVLPYPAEMNDLDTGKTYCWKVDGLVGNVPVAQSEIWEFKLKKEKIKIDTIRYVQLKKRLDASVIDYGSHDVFYFIFSEAHNNVQLNLKLMSEINQQEIVPQPQKVEESVSSHGEASLVSFGDNKYGLDLANYDLPPGKYIVTITDSYKRKYYQRILIK